MRAVTLGAFNVARNIACNPEYQKNPGVLLIGVFQG
jgi:hypothetical protein